MLNKLVNLYSVDNVLTTITTAIDKLDAVADIRAVRAKVSLDAVGKHQAAAALHTAEVERAKKVAAKLKALIAG